MRAQILVDAIAESIERAPGLIGKREGDARLLVNARQPHREVEVDLAGSDGPADWRRGTIMGRSGERQMPFAARQTGCRIETDPACAGEIDLRPGMQVCENLHRTVWPIHGCDVRLQLDQITGDEARGE